MTWRATTPWQLVWHDAKAHPVPEPVEGSEIVAWWPQGSSPGPDHFRADTACVYWVGIGGDATIMPRSPMVAWAWIAHPDPQGPPAPDEHALADLAVHLAAHQITRVELPAVAAQTIAGVEFVDFGARVVGFLHALRDYYSSDDAGAILNYAATVIRNNRIAEWMAISRLPPPDVRDECRRTHAQPCFDCCLECGWPAGANNLCGPCGAFLQDGVVEGG